MKFFRSEKNIYALVLIASVIVFILTNTFASALSQRFSLRLDTTENDLYRLSDTTAELCTASTGDTEIYVIADKNEYPVMFRRILDSYAQLSDRLKIQYIDPYTAPEFLEYWQQQGAALEENDILVVGSTGFRQLAYTDLLVYSGEKVIGVQAEQRISSAISYVNSADRSTVVFITGHNERPSEKLTAVFTDANLTVDTDSTENLGDASLAVIACPTRDYTEAEISSISAFLNSGGKLMVFLEPGSEHENIKAFLRSWNTELTDKLITDDKYCIGGNALNLMPVYTTHPINAFFEDNQYAMVVPSCRALDVGTTTADVEVLPLLISSPVSYCKASEETGSFKLALIAEKPVQNGSAAVLTIGSQYIYGDDVLSSSSYANREFFAECIKYLLNADTALSIAPKTLDAQPLVISGAQTRLCTVLYLAVFPLVCFVAGMAVFIGRRKL